jgi:uncharacterized membrane protein YdjX (TVP38/TMEM64 family)
MKNTSSVDLSTNTSDFTKSKANRKVAAIKGAFLLVFIITAIVVVRFTPVREFLNAERLAAFLDQSGLWAPLLYIGVYVTGVCLFIPGALLTTLGAAIFGPYLGFVYVWVGAMLGASLAFFIGRYLGRDFAASLVGDRLKKYDDGIEREGFATVLYLRLIYFPFSPLNFGMGLTKVRFRDYFFGTALGIIVGTFAFTFVVGTLKEVWASSQWAELLSWKMLLSLMLFLSSFCIPKIIDKVKGALGVKIA